MGAHRGFLVRSELALPSRPAKGDDLTKCMITRCVEGSVLGYVVCFDLTRGRSFAPPLGIVTKILLKRQKGPVDFDPSPPEAILCFCMSHLYCLSTYKFLIPLYSS